MSGYAAMSPADYELFMRLLDTIQPPPPPRYYAESDGDPHRKEYYVCHTQTMERIDCGSMKEARELATRLNREHGYVTP